VATAGTVDYLSIFDNHLTGGAANTTPTHSTNGGNNTGWDFGGGPDTTPPVISGIATSTSTTTATISWNTDEIGTSQVEYGLDTNYGSYTGRDSNLVLSHSVNLTGLTPNTVYHYRVASVDGSGNAASSTDRTFNTNDITVPRVTLVAPIAGETVFGPQVYLAATSTDDVAVAGVQFKLDTNTNIGSEVKGAPYTTTWDATSLSGSHTIIAVTRDAAGNYATSSAATITVSSSGAVYLVPGPGFSGLTPQPAAIGTGPGSDATSTARWDVVPHQSISNMMNVGVTAFHMNGIKKVSFSVNGGPWRDVTTPTRNPETNVVEYWATLRASDFADGPIEVRAIAYPRAGIPRVLGGSQYQYAVSGQTGEFSLQLHANANGGLAQTIRYVSTTGSDTTGDGSANNPFATIYKAAQAINTANGGSADNGLIYLQAGDYAYSAPTNQTAITTTNGFLTISGAPGVSKDSVRITSTGVLYPENVPS
jgi:hypothetical protein